MTTNELHDLLSHIGYQSRPQQETLFNHLCDIDHDGTIVQAGTGVGKSIAVIAAAVHAYRKTGIQSLIVTPTRVLMDQYMDDGRKTDPRLLLAWDILNVLLWLIVIGALAAIFLPAVMY